MIDAARGFAAKSGPLPSLWLYGTQDALFGPEFARQMAAAWNESGGRVDLKIIAPDHADGHGLFEATEGVAFWAPLITTFLERILPAQPLSSLQPQR